MLAFKCAFKYKRYIKILKYNVDTTQDLYYYNFILVPTAEFRSYLSLISTGGSNLVSRTYREHLDSL